MSQSLQNQTLLVSIPWETRNLGRPAYALDNAALEQQPVDPQQLSQLIQTLEVQEGPIFIQARIDQHHTAMFPVLQASGFYFAEMTLHPYTPLNKNAVLARFLEAPQEFVPGHCTLDDLSMALMDTNRPEEVEQVKAIAYETFTDSRFHYDSQCPVEIANRRYVFWVDDMLANPKIQFDLILLKNRIVGFMARRDNELLLAGFAQSHTGMGLGSFLWLSSLKILKAEGYPETHTTISAFNSTVHNLYGRLGFKFRNPEAAFHYWTP